MHIQCKDLVVPLNERTKGKDENESGHEPWLRTNTRKNIIFCDQYCQKGPIVRELIFEQTFVKEI